MKSLIVEIVLPLIAAAVAGYVAIRAALEIMAALWPAMPIEAMRAPAQLCGAIAMAIILIPVSLRAMSGYQDDSDF